MTITRKDFLSATAGTVFLMLQACGGGGDGGTYTPPPDEPNPPAPPPPAPAPPAQTCGAGNAAIAGNHGHMLTIAAADLDATANRTYDITGTANHAHTVTFTPAQLQALKAGQSVMVTSSTDSAHEHVVTASCTTG
jgi:hypothetical protein